VTESNAEDAVRSATQLVSPFKGTYRSKQTEIESLRTFPKKVNRSVWVKMTSNGFTCWVFFSTPKIFATYLIKCKHHSPQDFHARFRCHATMGLPVVLQVYRVVVTAARDSSEGGRCRKDPAAVMNAVS
jgi:hypothetical protein